MIPPTALAPSTAAVVVALARRSRATYGDLMAETGFTSSTIHKALHHLRRQGWVTWEKGKDGTIRATFGIVRVAALTEGGAGT